MATSYVITSTEEVGMDEKDAIWRHVDCIHK